MVSGVLRRVTVLLAVAMTAGMAACGGSPQPTPTAGQMQPTSTAGRPKTAPTQTGVASEQRPVGKTFTGVAYVVGLSTDPDGRSALRGIGVASSVLTGRVSHTSVMDSRVGGDLRWLGRGRLIASGAREAPPELYRVAHDRLTPTGRAPIPGDAWNYAYSPDRRLIAFEPRRHGRASGTVLVEHADGRGRHRVARGQLTGWTPDRAVVLLTGRGGQFAHGTYVALDLRTGARTEVLSSHRVAAAAGTPHGEIDGFDGPQWSADGRYIAALASLPGKHPFALVLARADGRVVRVVITSDTISMFAWAPHGHRLAYTTSGFAIPHELYLLRGPRAKRRRIYSQAAHFDWVTWSPDAKWLLIDDQHHHAWRLLSATGHRQAGFLTGAAGATRRLPRLGGAPLWCCPQDHFAGN